MDTALVSKNGSDKKFLTVFVPHMTLLVFPGKIYLNHFCKITISIEIKYLKSQSRFKIDLSLNPMCKKTFEII